MACLNRDTVEAFAAVYFKAIKKYVATKEGMEIIAKASKPGIEEDTFTWKIPSSIGMRVVGDFQYAYASSKKDTDTLRFQRACDLISYYCLPHDGAFGINWHLSGLGFCCEYLHDFSTDDAEEFNYGSVDDDNLFTSSYGISIQKIDWDALETLLNDFKKQFDNLEEDNPYKLVVLEEGTDDYKPFREALRDSIGKALHTWLTGKAFAHPFYIRPQMIYDGFPSGINPDEPVVIENPNGKAKVSDKQFDFTYDGTDLKKWNDMWEMYADPDEDFGNYLLDVNVDKGKTAESRSFYGIRKPDSSTYNMEKAAYVEPQVSVSSIQSKDDRKETITKSAFYLNFANGMTEPQALEMIQLWDAMQDLVTDSAWQLEAYKNDKAEEAVKDIFDGIFGYEKLNVKDNKDVGKDLTKVVYDKTNILQMCQPLAGVASFFKRNARVQFRALSRYDEVNSGAFAISKLRSKAGLPSCESLFKTLGERSPEQLFQIQQKMPYNVLEKKRKEPLKTEEATERLVLAVSEKLLSAPMQKAKGLTDPFIHAHRIDSAMIILHELYHTWFNLIDVNYAANIPVSIKFKGGDSYAMNISYMEYHEAGEDSWLQHMSIRDTLSGEENAKNRDNLAKLNWKKLNVDTFIILMFKLYAQTYRENGLLFGKSSKQIKRDYVAVRFLLNFYLQDAFKRERQGKFFERDKSYWLEAITEDASQLIKEPGYKGVVASIKPL